MGKKKGKKPAGTDKPEEKQQPVKKEEEMHRPGPSGDASVEVQKAKQHEQQKDKPKPQGSQQEQKGAQGDQQPQGPQQGQRGPQKQGQRQQEQRSQQQQGQGPQQQQGQRAPQQQQGQRGPQQQQGQRGPQQQQGQGGPRLQQEQRATQQQQGQQGQYQQQGQRGPQQQQGQGGPRQQQGQGGPQQQQGQRGPQQQQGQQGQGALQQQQGQRAPQQQQGQGGPRLQQEQQATQQQQGQGPQQQQGQRGPQQQQGQRGPQQQQGQGGPRLQQEQRATQQQQGQGPQQQQGQQGQYQQQGQRGPQQQQGQGGPRQQQGQGGPQQQQGPRGPQQQQGQQGQGVLQQQQGQRAPQQQQGQGGPRLQQEQQATQQQQGQGPQQQQGQQGQYQQQGQRGPQQQQGQGGPRQQQGQGGPQQQQGQRGPQQQQGQQGQGVLQQQQGQRAPQQQQGQGGPRLQQEQQATQQQQGQGPQQQQGQQGQYQQQGQRGPQQRQGQGGPRQQQGQGGPQQQQGQRGPQQQQGQQGQGAPQQQQGKRGPQQQQGQRGPQQQQGQGDQKEQAPQKVQPPQKSASQSLRQLSLSPGGSDDGNKKIYEPGKLCIRKIPIESNYLNLQFKKQITNAIHYDVLIKPETPKSLLTAVMEEFRRQNYPSRYPSFDGKKNLYSPSLLPFGEEISGKVTVQADNGPKTYEVEVKKAAELDLTILSHLMNGAGIQDKRLKIETALQCLNVVFMNAAGARAIRVGRSYFTPPRDTILSLGEGMEMYYGFFQSVIGGWSMYLNVDVAHKQFPIEQSILKLICELGSDYRTKMDVSHLTKPISGYLNDSLSKYLKGLKVLYELPKQPSSKRLYRVNGTGPPPASAKFRPDNGPEMTVQKYFEDTKRTRLNYPHLPSLHVGPRDKKILIPLEFCSVVGGQTCNRRMTENQTSAMIKLAATSTDVRKQKIMRSITEVDYNKQNSINEFGLSVGSEFLKLEARVLKPPTLEYDKGKTVVPSKGVWRNDSFIKPATCDVWTLVHLCRRPVDLDNLAGELFKAAPRNGMRMAKPVVPYYSFPPRFNFNDVKKFFSARTNHQLIVCVIPDFGKEYAFVKQAAELNAGCLTQCIKERTLRKLNGQTVGNILLKLNSKLDGCNHKMAPISRPPILSRPCMIMGADVTHPSPDSQNIPSVAAVTASHDPSAFKYNFCWRLQPPKVEIIEDMCAITKEQLMYFQKANGCKPETIVFFRDGVSEGQFEQVRRAEIAAIQAACRQLQAQDYEPKITFLVVQKRHHTRFFPTNPRDSEDRNNNVPAGTCVDTQIVARNALNFYLVSHASIQGVAKPTKYVSLYDDNNLDNDQVQALTYHLCHMFARCTRSVSYPAPTYYAHLAAARAKVYIENQNLNLDKLRQDMEKIQIHTNILAKNPMFFV